MAGTSSSQASEMSPIPPLFDGDEAHLEESVSETQINSSSGKTRKRKRKEGASDISWRDHFDCFPEKEMVSCKYCKRTWRHGKGWGTGNYFRHIESEHRDKLPSGKQSELNTSGGVLGGRFVFDLAKFHVSVVKFLIARELPFSLVESDEFNELLVQCQPNFRSLSGKKARRIALNDFTSMKCALVDRFASLSCKFVLTCDSWKYFNKEHYIVVTCHWVEDDWHLEKRILSFQHWKLPHSSVAISRVLSKVCRDYGISDRIFSISLDNVSANSNAMGYLKASMNPVLNGLFFHNRCACHILNLCVQDGLKELRELIYPIRNIVSLVRCSAPKRQELKRLCESHNIQFRQFKTDLSTRWNSTLDMVKSILPCKVALIEFCAGTDIDVDDVFFDKLSNLTNLLSVFFTCTKLFSGVYYPTTHLVLGSLLDIMDVFNNSGLLDFFGPSIDSMEEKFVKYYKDIPFLYVVASILDPRVKGNGVTTLLDDFQTAFDGLVNAKKMYDDAWKALSDLYEIYEKENSSVRGSAAGASLSAGSSSSSGLSHLARIRCKSSSTTSSSSLSEIVVYNSTPRLAGNEESDWDILAWWKSNAFNFPILAKIAKDILTPPVSTVASESVLVQVGGL